MKKKILVIDDEKIGLALLKEIGRVRGFASLNAGILVGPRSAALWPSAYCGGIPVQVMSGRLAEVILRSLQNMALVNINA